MRRGASIRPRCPRVGWGGRQTRTGRAGPGRETVKPAPGRIARCHPRNAPFSDGFSLSWIEGLEGVPHPRIVFPLQGNHPRVRQP